jgi:hypothetical protein
MHEPPSREGLSVPAPRPATRSGPGPQDDARPAEAITGRFPTPPQAQLPEIRRVINETGQPELVPELTWTRPDKAIAHRLYLPKIQVDRARRPGGEMIACSLCDPERPKCLSFYLLWSADGHLRIVGHMCGATHFGQHAFREMEDAARREATRLADEDFLLEYLPRLPLWLDDLDSLAPACGHAQRLKREFAKGVPSLHVRLVRMVKDHGGALVIVRKRSGDGPSGFRSSLGGGAEYETVPVAYLRGQSFLTPSYNPVSELERIEADLLSVTGGRTSQVSEEDAVEIICSMSEAGLHDARRKIEAARRRAARLVERLIEIAAFVSDAGIDELDRWARHDENEFRFTLERVPQGLAIRVRWDQKVTLDLRADLRPPALKHIGR